MDKLYGGYKNARDLMVEGIFISLSGKSQCREQRSKADSDKSTRTKELVFSPG